MRRRSFIKATGGGIAIGGLAGCLDRLPGGGDSEDMNLAIISGPGGFGDNAYNDSALQGLEQAAEENDGSVNQIQGAGGEYRSLQSQLAESEDDYDVIVCVGFYQAEALAQSADEYPDQNWMLINQGLFRDNGEHYENVAGYVWGNHEMSYLAGVVSGTMTTRELSYEGNSNDPSGTTVGFVGGVDSALIRAFEQAYVAGVEWVNPDVDVRVGYAGSFEDPSAGREVALSQYDAGADIVYHAAAGTGPGIFQAAQDRSRFAIGVDGEQSLAFPEYSDVIVGSAVKDINVGTYDVATAAHAGNWEDVAGQEVYGLDREAVRFNKGADVGERLPSVVDDNVEEATQGIVDGDITVPCSATGCQ